MLNIEPIKAFSDNYIWAVRNDRVSKCLVVDPGDASPVEKYLQDNQLELSGILITHHHFDHTGGLQSLKSNHRCPVYGPDNEKIAGIDRRLKQGDKLHLDVFDLLYDIIEVPGHTLDHICFVASDHVFCGDTLFAGGCGRLFEGTPKQMWHSLQKLKQLNHDTRVYCAHEYTQANLNFALAVEPENTELQTRKLQVDKLRQKDQITLPSTMGLETATNPFLRANEPSIKQAAETFSRQSLSTPEEIFAVVRQWKDNF